MIKGTLIASNDRLIGGEGDDKLFITTSGDNLLTGGAGADQFWIANGELPEAANTVTDFEAGVDAIGLGGLGLGFEDLSLTQQGTDTLIATSEQELAILPGISVGGLEASNFVFLG